MKLRLLIRNTLAAVAAFGTLAAFSSHALAQLPEPRPATSSGLQILLSTGGYKFVLPSDPATALPPGAPTAFQAVATLYNHSPSGITFTFPDPAAALRKFTFRIFDKVGTLVWQSDADVVAPTALTNATLARGARWSRALIIPLKPGGTALAPGVYSLEAAIDADKNPGAVSIFEVVAPPPPGEEQGIDGLVLKRNPPEAANILPVEIPAAGALVNVVEVRTKAGALTTVPFVWSGRTDDAGKFKVRTPAGRFRVTATLPATAGGAAVPVTKTVDVTVEAGKYGDVTIHLPAAPPPPTISGIRGLVLYGPISPVGREGEPNEAPAVGARVVIDEILPDPSLTARAPFRWTGFTNREGRFHAPTPPGNFKVTAALGLALPGSIGIAPIVASPPSATTDESVVAGKISEVTLHIDTGLR